MQELVKRERTVLDEAMDYATHEIRHGKEHLERLLSLERAMLPIEKEATGKIRERILEARQDVEQTRIGLPKLSFEPLSWRHSSGLPKIVPMSLQDSGFMIWASRSEYGSLASGIEPPGLPNLVRDCFADVLKLAESYCGRQRSKMSYTFEFDGMIPDSTRLKIAEAVHSFDKIFLLVETPDTAWKIERTKGITRRRAVREALAAAALDPIVVGYKLDTFWVIDKFDLTNVEQYVLDEFSRLALPAGE